MKMINIDACYWVQKVKGEPKFCFLCNSATNDLENVSIVKLVNTGVLITYNEIVTDVFNTLQVKFPF